MDMIVSPRGIVDIERPGQGVLDLSQAGFGQALLDFAMFCSDYELECVGKRKKKETSPKRLWVSEHPENLYDKARPVLDRCVREGLSLPAARAPYLCRNTKREDLRELMAGLSEECIRICGRIGCTALIVRPLFSGVFTERKRWRGHPGLESGCILPAKSFPSRAVISGLPPPKEKARYFPSIY